MNVFQQLIPKDYATNAESTTQSLAFPESNAKDVMTEILRQGAQQMLTHAIQEEVDEWIEQRALGIGYGRAARLIDFMAEDGLVDGLPEPCTGGYDV